MVKIGFNAEAGEEDAEFLLTSEDMFMQKVNYIHNNPVKDGFAEHTRRLSIFKRPDLAATAFGS